MTRFVCLLGLRLVFAWVFLDGQLVIDTCKHAVTGEPEVKQTWVFPRP